MTVLDTEAVLSPNMDSGYNSDLAIQLDWQRSSLARQYDDPQATVASFEANVCEYLNAYQRVHFDNAAADLDGIRLSNLPDEMNQEITAIAGYTMDSRDSIARLIDKQSKEESATPAKIYSDVMVRKLSRLMFGII